MSFSTAVIVSVLFFCISDASASVIPQRNLEEFNVHIVERGTRYVEKIAIDEKNDLEYFQVPAHNGLTEADYLYDFKNKLSVRRDQSNGACYAGPLPDDLPKPTDLRNDLQMVSNSPSNSTDIVRKYWSVSEEVDKALLSQAVQDFCGQFPVYRLQEVALNVDGRTRFARQSASIPEHIGFCRNGFPSKTCLPEKWLYSLKIRQNHCTWWVKDCRFDSQRKTICNTWNHLFSSMVCYTVRCP